MRKVLAVFMIIILLAALTACGSQPAAPAESGAKTAPAENSAAAPAPADGKTIIGLSVPSLTDNFIKMLSDGIVERYKADGVEVIVASCDMQQDKQIEQMENFAAMGAKQIIAFPVVTEGLEATVKKLREHGVQIFFMGAIPEYEIDGYKQVDQTKVGAYTAQMAIKWLDAKYKDAAPKSIKTAVFTSSNISDLKVRSEYMVNTIKADPRVDIVFTKDNVMENTEGIEGMTQAFAANHDIKLVLTISDTVATGVNTVIMSEKGINPEDIGVFATTFSASGVELVNKSKTNETVLRGIMKYGSDDIVGNIVDVSKRILGGKEKIPVIDLDPITSINTVGYETPK